MTFRTITQSEAQAILNDPVAEMFPFQSVNAAGSWGRLKMTEFATKVAAFAAATNNDLYDTDYCGEGVGEWLVQAVETQETLADFEASSAKWAECSSTQSGKIAGLSFVCWAKVQARRGDQRRSMWVIDFGDRRVAIDADASYYL